MKIHGRPCREGKAHPCPEDHEYLCVICGTPFQTNEDSFFDHPFTYKVSPSLWYPACSFTCYSRNAKIDMEVLKEAIARGEASISEIEALVAIELLVDEWNLSVTGFETEEAPSNDT